MNPFGPDAVTRFLSERSQEVHTLLGVQLVLVLLVGALLAYEGARTSAVSLPGGSRSLRSSMTSLLVLFSVIVVARLVSIT